MRADHRSASFLLVLVTHSKKQLSIVFSSLTFNSAGDDAFDDALLGEGVEDDDGDDGEDEHCHKCSHIARAVAALEILHGDGDGAILTADDEIGQEIVVPDPHGVEYRDGDGDGL